MTRDNRALACIEGGMYVGSGFIIAAVMQAETFVLSLIFFGLGELAMVLFSFLYQYWTKFDDRRAVEQKNIAAGLHWGMSQAALGLLLARAIYLSNSVSAPAGLWLLPTLKVQPLLRAQIIVFGVWFALGSPYAHRFPLCTPLARATEAEWRWMGKRLESEVSGLLPGCCCW